MSSSVLPSKPRASGWMCEEQIAGRRACVRPLSQPAHQPGRPGSPGHGQRPRRPSPSGLPAAAPGPLFLRLELLPWAARLQDCASRLTSPETRYCSGSGFACKSTPARDRPPPESRLLRPEGYREQWTVEARPQPFSLVTENGPWSSAFLLANTAPSPRRERG